MIYEPSLRILWISGGRAVLEDEEGFRIDVLLKDITADDEMIGKLSPSDAFRLGAEAARLRG
jgi:hypothetical protein